MEKKDTVIRAPKRKMMGPGGPRGFAPGEKPKDMKGTLIKTIKYMRNDLVAIIIAFILAVGGVVASIVVPDVLGSATDTLMEGVVQKTVYKQLSPAVEMFNPDNYVNKIEEEDLYVLLLQDTKISELIDFDYIYNIDNETVEMLKQIPENMRHISLRSIFGYDNEESNVHIKSAYKDCSTIGELAAALGLESMFASVPQSYVTAVQNMDFKSPPQVNLNRILTIFAKIISLICASSLMSYLQGFILAGVAQKVSYRFRKDINNKIDKLPLSFFDKTTNGEVMSLITNDVDTISNSLNQSLSQLLTSATTIIGVIIMMLTISPILTLLTIVSVPLSAIIMMFVVKKSQKYFINQQKYLGHVNGQIEENFSGHNVVKLFNGEDNSIEEFDKNNEELYKSAWNSQFYSGLMQPLSKMVGNLVYVAVCVVGGLRIVDGQITVGNLQSFIQYVRQFNQPITQIASVFNTLQSTIAASERVFKFLESEEEVETGEFCPTVVKGDVCFNHIKFGYSSDKIIINDFSSDISSGQRIAIVGPTGAGKTTIIKLLMRFYELDAGKIFLDGKDISTFSRNGLRRQIGMVLQDTWLFNGSIMENIRYGRLDATDEEVMEAAKIAFADHFIETLPGGYDFVIDSDATNISQGQKQLLTIARAVLADNKLLILDEATSSVDTRTEMLIQKAMDKLMIGRTSFVIAHRLSTIKDADKILVLNDGDVVEQGTHSELLALNGAYSTLYNSQFEMQ